ncbi:glycerophosphodiester phosphodiesterase family protein [Lachnospiraceae bacterium 54-53]
MKSANGIETDIRRTKDGVLVLFHDECLDRITSGTGCVSDYTWSELSEILVCGEKEKNFIPDRIVSLEQFLHYFSHLDLILALEFKDRGAEEDTLNLVRARHAMDKCIFTSFEYEDLAKLRRLSETAMIGYLTSDTGTEVEDRLRAIAAQQICMKADFLTRELVDRYHAGGLSVRAWGITAPEMMEPVIRCGVDGGMTVNFPDKLYSIK